MNKVELVAEIAKEANISKKDAEARVFDTQNPAKPYGA